MTIRFIQAWNGYYPGQIVSNPNGNTEANLVSLGYASADLNGTDGAPITTPKCIAQTAYPVIYPPSSIVLADGRIILGTAGGFTLTLSATSGAGVTATASGAAFLGAALDVGKIITVQDGVNLIYATITAFVSATQATVTISGGTLSTVGPWVATSWRVSFPLPNAYPSSWVYLPADAVVGGLAGLYYCTWTNTVLGQIKTAYSDVSADFIPYAADASGSLANAVGSVAAFSQATGDFSAFRVTIPGGAMGPNGFVRVYATVTASLSSNQRTGKLLQGGVLVGLFNVAGSASGFRGMSVVQNRGSAQQLASSVAATSGVGFGAIGYPAYTTIDTTVDHQLLFTIGGNTNFNFTVLEGITVEIIYGA